MNAPTGNLFPKPAAVASAALHMDVLRRIADTSTPLPGTLDDLAAELNRSTAQLTKDIAQLECDGLAIWKPGVPLDVAPTRQGALAALGVGVATGEAEVDLDAFFLVHDRIRPNPNNPRGEIREDDPSIEEMLETIIAKGLLQPLLVYPDDGDGVHMLHAGERRWRAVGLGIRTDRLPADFRIPCRQRQPSEEEAAAQSASVALIENGQRKNLSMLEEARAFRLIIEANPGLPIAVVARRHGRDPRTVQEMQKVLREASETAIAACEAGELRWEELRDSVKTVKLSPAQALIVLEICARMDTEDPAADEEGEGPDWIEAAFCPVTGPHMDLVARSILQFQQVDGVALCRLRTDNPRLEGWLDAAFGCEPGERRSLDPDKREAVLFEARAKELGSFTARDLEQSGKYATPWLNIELTSLADLHDETAPLGPRASSPALQPEGLPDDAHEPRKPHGPEADPAEGAREVRGQGNGPAVAKTAEPQPNAHQRLILAEVLHKQTVTGHDHAKMAGSGPWALVKPGTLGSGERGFSPMFQNGWLMGASSAGPNGEEGLSLTGHGREILGFDGEEDEIDHFWVVRTRDEARKDAGLSLPQRHELAQSGRYAWEPLNTAAPKTAEPPAQDELELAPETALALVELTAAIARDGVQIPGKPWRCAPVWDFSLSRSASEISFNKLAAWVTDKGQWYGYLKERGERWLQANGVDVTLFGAINLDSSSDLARFRDAAGVAAPEDGRWCTSFLNPKVAPATGPQRGAAEAEPERAAAPASGARDHEASGAAQLIRELAEDTQWASELLGEALAKHPLPSDRNGEALTRIAEMRGRVARARDFLTSIQAERA